MDSWDIESQMLGAFKYALKCVSQSNTMGFNRRVHYAHDGHGHIALKLSSFSVSFFE